MTRSAKMVMLFAAVILLSFTALGIAHPGNASEEGAYEGRPYNTDLGTAVGGMFKAVSPFIIALVIVIVYYRILR